MSNATAQYALQPATFSLDAYNNGDTFLHGFTTGQRWNGFACPYFALEDGLRLAGINNLSPYCGRVEYDPIRDAFIFEEHADGGDNALASVPVVFWSEVHNGQKVYGIGAFAWCWYEAEANDAAARFSRELVRELREMRRVGANVPDAAIERAHSKCEVEDVLTMPVSEAASLMIELAQVR